ncbi:putative Transcriptional regulator, GntR family [Vibrio nigripulchritudo MADA3029]|uniref:FadR/GntR family transcriptional regulator n=1 Tax=Vibrio nigripulchritudo TaxID=28173 RepID=UPI0003B21580|nr:FCD domain-containing protein [Vibrio nigripulchritudo]CCN45574.1 putative Transcriptional regulator, GntR family [Vibrio nigripulchritudo MADA3020]CCN55827.1 putative Transcriptional regulator, GntR family [Vibrio nigripulchritudo MADA3021]CCN57051.1 putative Transcriptional regulator, GntR family [Vibrio nigripulchritudo MADA3029]
MRLSVIAMNYIESTNSSLVSEAIGEITAFMRGADLSPGDKLPSESYFARELNKSRTVVREAFRSLAALNLIKLNAGKRAEVAALDYSTISPVIEHGIHTEQISVQQVYDVRRTIEMRTATLAALRRSETQAETILFHAKSMVAHRDNPENIMSHDIAFHQTIAMASCNPIFALMIGAFEGVTKLTWPVGWKSRESQDKQEFMLNVHLAIAEAIRDGNPQEANMQMALHFDESVRALLEAGIQ